MRNLVIPKRGEWETDTLSSTYGKFFVEPLERGYGQTIGNSLRRMLLSSLPGTAVTAVKIDGVLHEFSTIPGVKEDVTNLVLNLKKLRLKLEQSDKEILFLEGKGEGVVQAGQIKPNSNVKILNPDFVIATLARDGKIKMEITVEKGRGYVPVEKRDVRSLPVGTIPIDAIFSSVLKVNYEVTTTRRGHVTDYDCLTMEIWTDGAILPADALAESARVLKDSMDIFIGVPKEMEKPKVELEKKKRILGEKEKGKLESLLDQEVNILELSVRAIGCLEKAKIKRIKNLVSKSPDDLLKYKNFGKKSLDEIEEELAKLNPLLHLGMRLDGKGKDDEKKT